MRRLALLLLLLPLAGCGTVKRIATQTVTVVKTEHRVVTVHKPVTPKTTVTHLPPGSISAAQWNKVQLGEPAGVLAFFIPEIRTDKDGSGDTPVPAQDGHTIYDIVWHCLDKHCDAQTVADKREYQK